MNENVQEERYVFFEQDEWDAFMSATSDVEPLGAAVVRDPDFAQTTTHIKFGGYKYLICKEDGICLLVDATNRRELTAIDERVIANARKSPLDYVSAAELVYILLEYYRDGEVAARREMRVQSLYHFQIKPVLEFCKAAADQSIPMVFVDGLRSVLKAYIAEHK